jgi:hypothetical protein
MYRKWIGTSLPPKSWLGSQLGCNSSPQSSKSGITSRILSTTGTQWLTAMDSPSESSKEMHSLL